MLIKQQKPLESEPYLEHIEPGNEDGDKTSYLYLLVEGYQSEGMHENALEVLDRIEHGWPEHAETKEFKKVRKISNRAKSSGKKIKSQIFKEGKAAADSTQSTLIVVGLLALVFCVYLGINAYLGSNRSVYLVNGVATSYKISIDGQEYDLGSNSVRKIILSEGKHELKAVDEKFQNEIEPTQFSMSSNFWGRCFYSRCFVVNPDKAALVYRMKAYYGTNVNLLPENEYVFFTNQTFYTIDGVDCAFKPLPESLRMKKSHSHKSRVQVEFLRPEDVGRISQVFTLQDELGDGVANQFAMNALNFELDDSFLLNYVINGMEPEQAISYLKSKIDRKPKLVPLHIKPKLLEIHKKYQDLLTQEGKQQEAQNEYKELSKAEPDNGHYTYLLGRITKDSAERLKLYEKAIDGKSISVSAAHALTLEYLSLGEFEKAEAPSARIPASGTGDVEMLSARTRYLIAAQKWEELKDFVSTVLSKTMPSLDSNTILLTLKTEGIDQALAIINNPDLTRGKSLRISSEPGNQELIKMALKMNLEYKDYLKQFVIPIVGTDKYIDTFDKVLIGDLDIDEELEDIYSSSQAILLALLLENYKAADEKVANKLKAKVRLNVMQMLTDEGPESVELAKLLTKGDKITWEEIRTYKSDAMSKSLAVLYLGLQYPQHADKCKELGFKLNYNPIAHNYFYIKAYENNPDVQMLGDNPDPFDLNFKKSSKKPGNKADKLPKK